MSLAAMWKALVLLVIMLMCAGSYYQGVKNTQARMVVQQATQQTQLANAVTKVHQREQAAIASASLAVADLQEQIQNEQTEKNRLLLNLRTERRRVQLTQTASSTDALPTIAAAGYSNHANLSSNLQATAEQDLVELASECDRLAIVHAYAQRQLIADRQLTEADD
jgi:hypothetical protein